MKNPDNAGYAGLFARIDQIQPHPEDLKKEIIERSCIEQFKKNDLMVKPGDTSRHCYFIIDGFVRLYHDHKRKEVTTWFLHKGDFMIQLNGYYFNQESPEYLQASEDTTCIKLHIDDQTWLCEKYPLFFHTYATLTQLYYFQLTQRDAWKAYKAKEKYRKLLEEYPYIIQLAQCAHIASYLGISEFHYSKIKNHRL
ncbi:Crp/Fnr family transcriptional regulator [Chitinophaga barathri]|uniref:Cyclic nucleotide-binding domain-containing protein n=1 Tax=Chitinophaga barathri TaxID=1647451 RepID=A0A3N4M7R0_9BACT|nr:cyclic nucleotide-binding domain-containing protein [Chitinophaga barathri]RPD39574.1 cyclic nucleotide-binding domain-containing protein [Chitinophaga barathri]